MAFCKSAALASVLVSVVMSVGCANLHYGSPVEPSARPNPQRSYLYGRFSLDSDFMNKVRLALQIENTGNGEILSLRLLNEQQVYAVEVEPGTYRLKGFIYALLGAVMEFETTKIQLPAEPAYLTAQFTAEPGKAYYLGDYLGSSRRTGFILTPFFVSTTFRGGIIGIGQNFSGTTSTLKTVLPQLKNVEFKPAWQGLITGVADEVGHH